MSTTEMETRSVELPLIEPTDMTEFEEQFEDLHHIYRRGERVAICGSTGWCCSQDGPHWESIPAKQRCWFCNEHWAQLDEATPEAVAAGNYFTHKWHDHTASWD